jgi:hypothetical protein
MSFAIQFPILPSCAMMSTPGLVTAHSTKAPPWAKSPRRLGIAKHSVLAIGDHLNDLPMLSSNTLAFCSPPPAYAAFVSVVKQTVVCVRAAGGYVQRPGTMATVWRWQSNIILCTTGRANIHSS